MKVFVSWSGKKSRDVARAFGEWLPLVLHAVEPFVSAKDIRAGTRWHAEVAKELDDTDFGLICVTKENQRAEWLNFEAGALAKSVNSSRVVPLAIDLSPADIASPLGQFQAMRLTKEEIGEVLTSMNEACSSPIADENLKKAVNKWWPDFEAELSKVEARDYGKRSEPSSPARTDRELIEELLDSVRGLNRYPVPVVESETTRIEAAVRQFEDTALKRLGVDAWRTSIQPGGVVLIETTPDPTAELRHEADKIGAAYGIRLLVRARNSPDKPFTRP